MPAQGCCQLVGSFPLDDPNNCFISINVSSSTESSLINNVDFIIGPTIGTVSVTGYAQNDVYIGCPSKASVQIPWIRKWDCDNNNVYFIPAGEGKSSKFGSVIGFADLKKTIGSYRIVSASSSSGPATLYTDEEQTDGYGLDYYKGPISFATSPDGVTWDGGGLGLGVGLMYLQSFNLELTPGQLPVASYSFVFVGSLSEEVL